MTQAAAPQQSAQQIYRARVYQAASGEWAWSIALDAVGDAEMIVMLPVNWQLLRLGKGNH